MGRGRGGFGGRVDTQRVFAQVASWAFPDPPPSVQSTKCSAKSFSSPLIQHKTCGFASTRRSEISGRD
jgi:hypothetical protein